MKMEKLRPLEILMVEDNPGDADLVLDTFASSKLRNAVHIAEDGEEALLFLKKEGRFSSKPSPDIILLDLNLPKISGHDVLDFIKGHEDLKHIPVIILTSSKADEDILKSYNLHANSYIQKPVDLEKFLEVARAIENFWLYVVTLAPHEHAEA